MMMMMMMLMMMDDDGDDGDGDGDGDGDCDGDDGDGHGAGESGYWLARPVTGDRSSGCAEGVTVKCRGEPWSALCACRVRECVVRGIEGNI